MKVFPPPRAVEVYNPVLRTFHWLMALLIFIALGLGKWSTQLPRGDLRSEVLFVHKSIGITVLALLVVRVVLRVVAGRAGLFRAAGAGGSCRGGRGPSGALCPDDRPAGQRLYAVQRRQA